MIEGNSEFLPSSKVINLINEDDEDQITIFVGVKPRIDTDVEFEFFNNRQEEYELVDFNKLEAKAILLPDP
jgi:hypothetical protein